MSPLGRLLADWASKMHVYPMLDWHEESDCLQHCEKLGGRSPSVGTLQEWQTLYEEIELIKFEHPRLPKRFWLSATEGDKNLDLSRLDHWPKSFEAIEGVWRDFYSGRLLDNYTKPWISANKDNDEGDNFNCIQHYAGFDVVASWEEWQCYQPDMGCACSYQTPPILRFRGFCPDTNIEDDNFTPLQLQDDPLNIILVGDECTQIKFNSSLKKWTLEDKCSNVTAVTKANQLSYALGKHNWTISGDTDQCSKGHQSYTIEMKLTACKGGEFTCDDGQCVAIEKRCDQLSDCRDKSDEIGCKILMLGYGYNKKVPPITSTTQFGDFRRPVAVKISLTLLRVVAIKEEDHSIELQFQITLEWKENRATYHNLKRKSYLNALSSDDINRLWLPLVVYTNTNQQETTRLGMGWEWATKILVKREGRPERSEFEMLEEIEIFHGDENSLAMVQSYTHEFQCVYQLEKYPFDTQVKALI